MRGFGWGWDEGEGSVGSASFGIRHGPVPESKIVYRGDSENGAGCSNNRKAPQISPFQFKR